MSFLETKHKKKSAIITSILLALILVGIFNFGMQYLDPPEEYGLAINFGDSNVGKGDLVEKTKSTAQANQPEEKQKEIEDVLQKKQLVEEEVITQDVKEAPVIEKIKEEDKEVVVDEVVQAKEKIKEKPKPSKETQDALNSLLNGSSDNGEAKGEGDDHIAGLKGNEKGNPDSSKYYGNNGSGGDSNYNLAGRSALSKPIEKPNCNEEGIVVVSIEVDNTGSVIKAIPGVKGSTNTAKCLLDPAKLAALKTKWNPDVNAPNKQRGTIIYRFTLSK